jgi:hypothetical protein
LHHGGREPDDGRPVRHGDGRTDAHAGDAFAGSHDATA